MNSTSHKGTGHGTGPMIVRDLHAILESDRRRKIAKKNRRIAIQKYHDELDVKRVEKRNKT